MEGECQQKSNEKYTLFYIVFQVLRVYTSLKNVRYSHQIFYFSLFYISFYISRHHFSKIVITIVPFLTNSLNSTHFNDQNLLLSGVTKVFCRHSLITQLIWIKKVVHMCVHCTHCQFVDAFETDLIILHMPASYFIDTYLLITVICICLQNNKIAVIKEHSK